MLERIRDHQSSRKMKEITESGQNHCHYWKEPKIFKNCEKPPKMITEATENDNYNIIISTFNYYPTHYGSDTAIDAGNSGLETGPLFPRSSYTSGKNICKHRIKCSMTTAIIAH